MLSLILFRHGKSDRGAEYGSDHERPLAKRGIKASKAMGKWLADRELVPDRAVTSSALRARQSLELAAEAGGWDCEIEATDALYGVSAPDVIRLARNEPSSTSRLLFTGHEPAFSYVASLLIGGGSIRLPTAAMAGIEFDDASWSDVAPGGGRLLWLQVPRMLP
ncbi:MAG: histidine phosphatase family protein [Acidimicrobiia bacterium]